MLRWLKRIVLGLLALVLLFAVFVVIAVHTDWGREQIRKRIEASLQSSFPGGAKVGRVEGSPFSELRVYDIELDTADGKPFVTIGELDVRVALRPLIRKDVRVEKLVVEDVAVYVTGAPMSNEPPKPSADEGPSEPSPWTIELPDIAVHKGRVSIAHAPRPTESIDLDDVELTGSMMKPSGQPLELTIGSVKAMWRQRGAKVRGSLALNAGDTMGFPRVSLNVAGVRVEARDLVIDLDRPRGTVEVTAPRASLAQVAPELDAPADAAVRIVAEGDRFELDGSLGTAQVRGLVRGDIAKRTGSAVVTLADVDAGALTGGKVVAKGDAFVVASYEPPAKPGGKPQLRAMVQAHGAWSDTPAGSATVSVDGTWNHLDATVLAEGAGGLSVAARGSVDIDGDRVSLAAAHVKATAKDVPLITANRAPVAGAIEADFTASGDLLPAPAITVVGKANGRAVRYDTYGAGYAEADFAALVTKDAILGAGTASVTGASQKGVAVGSTTITAYNCEGERRLVRDSAPAVIAAKGCTNKIFAHVVARPAAAPVTVVADATVTPGRGDKDPLAIVDVGSHRVTMANGMVWTGGGGHVVVGRDLVATVRGLRTGYGGAAFTVDGRYAVATDTLDGNVVVTSLPASLIDPKFAGLASGTLALKRRPGGRFDGTGSFSAKGVTLDPETPTFDADVHLDVKGSRVLADATVVTTMYGGVRVDLDVDGPRDITDPIAWRQLDRSAIRSATFTALRVDLAAAKVPTGGSIDGQVKIAGADTSGSMSVGSIHTVLGDAKGELTFAPAGQNVQAFTNADIEGLGTASITAELAFPDKPFNPHAWKRHGRAVLDKLIASIDKVEITPERLAALGLEGQPYKGRADVALNIVSGATTAKVDVDISDVEGGILARKIALHVHGETDRYGSKADVTLYVPEPTTGAPEAKTTLAKIEGQTPVDFDRWLTGWQTVGTSSLVGKLTIPDVSAPTLLSVFGRKDAASGILTGTADIRGTLATPTGHAEIRATKIQVAPSKSGIPIRIVNEAKLLADWGGVAGQATLTADEAGEGTLYVNVTGRPDQLATINGRAVINNFDLAPFAAFAPRDFAAAAGVMKGDVTIRGLDKAGKIRGGLHIEKAIMPITPLVGTVQGCPKGTCDDKDPLRDGARADLTIDDTNEFHLVASGYLGAGFAKVVAHGPRDVSEIVADLDLVNYKPVNELQPRINGSVHAKITKQGDVWHGEAHVQPEATVDIPDTKGDDLLDEDAPDDLFFVDEGLPEANFREPEKPWLVMDVVFDHVKVTADEFGLRAFISTDRLRISRGDTIGVDGAVRIDEGSTADIFGHNYAIETGEHIIFDGTLDANLSLELSHRFLSPNDFTMYVFFGDRISTTKPQFSAPGTFYTEGQLFGFLLGGEPTSEVGADTRNIGTGAGSSLLSSALGKRLKKRLPVQVDVIRCDLGTATTAASCTVGKWISEHFFLAGKHRLDARFDENTNEGELQYYITKEWELDGTFGDRGHDGGDLLWHRRW